MGQTSLLTTVQLNTSLARLGSHLKQAFSGGLFPIFLLYFYFFMHDLPFVNLCKLPLCCLYPLSLSFSGLSLVVGLVLYISSINDEVMNRPREPEQFFNYRYGWSFAFAASSFLLKEVKRSNFSSKSK